MDSGKGGHAARPCFLGCVEMTIEELRLRRLANQHLLEPAHPLTVARELCGIQAQFLSYALHALTIRSTPFDSLPADIVKSWTLRGTLHLFAAEDLPLMLHEGRKRHLRPCDTLAAEEGLSAERKRFFAQILQNSIRQGMAGREELKAICFEAGMTEGEARSLFDPWGGLIRALCEAGEICHQPTEKKAYRVCGPIPPLSDEEARMELTRRYFTHYGPATVRDAAAFFGTSQAGIRTCLNALPHSSAVCGGRTYEWVETDRPHGQTLPACIFLSGFDPLMVGYEKRENPFLPPAYLRAVFTLSGIVRPTVLLHGRVQGTWKKTGRTLLVSLLEDVTPADGEAMAQTAQKMGLELKLPERG